MNALQMRLLALIALVLALAPAAHARERAPGAPGKKADWAPANKQGFGTASATTSRIWFTLGDAGMGEAFYPDLQHPSARSLDFMVDGQTVTTGTVANAALTYTQTSELAKHWRLTRTYVSDPERDAILVKVRFDSLDNADHDVELAFDPALYGDGDDDVGWTRGHALLAHDRHIASAFAARPALTRTSSGYKGHDDDLLEHTYDALRPGNVVQQAHTRLTGRADHQDLTIALAFAGFASDALKTASAALDAGFDTRPPPTPRAGATTATRSTRSPLPRCRSPTSTRPRSTCSRRARTRTTLACSSPARATPGAATTTTGRARATPTRSPPRCWPRATRPPPTACSTTCSTTTTRAR